MVMKGEMCQTPPWLKMMLKTTFFTPCESHYTGGNPGKSECNMYCLDCPGAALCCFCLDAHHGHRYVQIRKSSYHNAVRVGEISKYIDVSGVQTYSINSAKVVFLNERPQQTRSGKGLMANLCEMCRRGLLERLRFCSIGCKLRCIKVGGSRLTFAPRGKIGREIILHSGSELEESPMLPESPMPPKQQKISAFRRMIQESGIDYSDDEVGSASASSDVISPATPPIVNNPILNKPETIVKKPRHRRKPRTPVRAPFF